MGWMDTGRPRWRKRLFAATISIVATLAVVEVVCRIAFPPQAPIRFEQEEQLLTQIGLAQFAEALVADPEMFWRVAPDSTLPPSAGINFGVLANGQQLREEHEIPLAKPAGEVRILFLGDSCTFGAGVEVTETFPAFVERYLAEDVPGTRFECINAGVPGYSLFQGWRLLETEGLAYDPDVIVISFGSNDAVAWDNRSDLEHYEEAHRRPPAPIGWSRAAQLVWKRIHARPPAEEKRSRLKPREFRDLLARVRDRADERGIALVTVVWTFQHVAVGKEGAERSRLQRALLDFSKNNRLVCIDTEPIFTRLCAEHAPGDVYFDKMHTSALANAAVAREIADRLLELFR